MEDRQERAEARIAHLTRALDEMSEVVAGQATRLDRLERQLRMLIEREAEREYAQGGSLPMADKPPPHW
ncbi:MAG: SlyX protein [Alphaproteobacteria bacterium HGW-Alphaproteobacteria-2]|nr:MAG: SlyX protein [Alphaproteobacteria bacterium HGW-Alphaproteobacteria-2]